MTVTTTRDTRHAAQFMTRREAAEAAKSISWRPSDARQFEVMGFYLWGICDEHINWVDRETFNQGA